MAQSSAHNPLACLLHDLSAPAHLDHPETTFHFLDQLFPRESWLLFISCSLRLPQSNALQLWWRNKRKILYLRCCGQAHSGTENLTLRVQIPGACSYDVSIQNRGETSWTGPLGFKPPVYKPHHIRKIKSFHNVSAHEAEIGIGKEFLIHFWKNLFHLNIQSLNLLRGRK